MVRRTVITYVRQVGMSEVMFFTLFFRLFFRLADRLLTHLYFGSPSLFVLRKSICVFFIVQGVCR
jgi:hypothetical protein